MINEIITPALLIDKNRLDTNLTRMKHRADVLNVELRPHLKTAKSAIIANNALREMDKGITVSTLAELEYFSDAGFKDIIYAVAITPEKLDRIARIQYSGATVTLIVDNKELTSVVAAKAETLKMKFHVLIEIDCGAHRGGVPPDSNDLVHIADAIRTAPNLILTGVLSHAGHSYKAKSTDEIIAIAEDERRLTVFAAETLRGLGHKCPIVSVGSTPTALFAKNLMGVTEMRPGVYMFFDRFQCQLGCCSENDIALSVLATVISRREDLGYCLIDAGSLALSQDVSTESKDGAAIYGIVCDAFTGKHMGDLAVVNVHQEHGFIRSLTNTVELLPTPGAKVRILPNHACMMAAPFDRYHVIDESDGACEVWPKVQGW